MRSSKRSPRRLRARTPVAERGRRRDGRVALADGSLRRHEALLTRMAALVEPERQRTRSAAADPGAPRRPGRPVLHARRGGAEAPKRRNAVLPAGRLARHSGHHRILTPVLDAHALQPRRIAGWVKQARVSSCRLLSRGRLTKELRRTLEQDATIQRCQIHEAGWFVELTNPRA
jgi:hypothetical protein